MTDAATAEKFSIGLTGGIGSGKTTVANLFAELGATVIDTDAIARQLTVSGGIAIPSIRAEFGDDFIDASGAMDRRKMREAVFAHPSQKERLESILHPLIRQEAERAASKAQTPYVIFVVPLLIESGRWWQRVSRVLVVDCPEELQISRVMERNEMTRDQVLAIMATQASRERRLDAADDVILNNGTSQDLVPEVSRLHALYLALATPPKYEK
jgi:dephospho-CoA kinase